MYFQMAEQMAPPPRRRYNTRDFVHRKTPKLFAEGELCRVSVFFAQVGVILLHGISLRVFFVLARCSLLPVVVFTSARRTLISTHVRFPAEKSAHFPLFLSPNLTFILSEPAPCETIHPTGTPSQCDGILPCQSCRKRDVNCHFSAKRSTWPKKGAGAVSSAAATAAAAAATAAAVANAIAAASASAATATNSGDPTSTDHTSTAPPLPSDCRNVLSAPRGGGKGIVGLSDGGGGGSAAGGDGGDGGTSADIAKNTNTAARGAKPVVSTLPARSGAAGVEMRRGSAAAPGGARLERNRAAAAATTAATPSLSSSPSLQPLPRADSARNAPEPKGVLAWTGTRRPGASAEATPRSVLEADNTSAEEWTRWPSAENRAAVAGSGSVQGESGGGGGGEVGRGDGQGNNLLPLRQQAQSSGGARGSEEGGRHDAERAATGANQQGAGGPPEASGRVLARRAGGRTGRRVAPRGGRGDRGRGGDGGRGTGRGQRRVLQSGDARNTGYGSGLAGNAGHQRSMLAVGSTRTLGEREQGLLGVFLK